ncbi:LysM peptidoglycan-binding domain-containing protein [Nocardioides sp.]|uniref:LysM peptidoglycan-binding domain-containing protein n=1 Tax=Nocardioides sp. TaxID=35761 RepID=UPI0035179247
MSTLTLVPQAAPRTSAHRTAARRVAVSRTQVVASPVRRGEVRLTRRGRLVVLVLACAVVAAIAVMVAAGSAATDSTGGAARVDVVTVAPGDTLWGIAGDVAADLDIDLREAVQRVEQLNVIDGGVVYAGQELRVPTR